jgi:peptidoglycan biosynthesis protein MviN/MurJ (putative lipid II flippase)
LAVSAEVLTLLLILRRRWGEVEGRKMLSAMFRVIVATLLMGVVVTAVVAWGQRTSAGALWTVAAGGVMGTVVYVSAGLLLRVRALRWLPDALPTWSRLP